MPDTDFTNEQAKAILDRMHELIDAGGRSQREISMRVGRSHNYLSEIFKHERLPNMETFLEFCDFFEITPVQFFEYGQIPMYDKGIITELQRLLKDDYQLLYPFLQKLKITDVQLLRKSVIELYKALENMGLGEDE